MRNTSKNLVISFLGDISLIGKYREFSAKNINPFLKISSVLQKSTYVVGNLEALSEGIDGENLLKKTRLKTDLRTLNFLKNIHINLVTLANNHVYDNLLDGFEKTINFLNRNSINYIGAAINKAGLNKIYIEKIKNARVAFLNYIHQDTKPSIPKNCPIKINEYNTDEIVKDIIFAKKRADYIFLLLHWGHDNSYYPAPWQRKEAKIFIEAGADFIIGHHSHTMQGFEKIGNGYAFYGLGNFCYSKFYHNGQSYDLDEKRHTHSFILKINLLEKKRYSFDLVPILNIDNFIYLGNHDQFKKEINRKSKLIPFFSHQPFYFFYIFYISFIYKLYFFLAGNDRKILKQIKKIDKRRISRFFKIFIALFKRENKNA